MKKNRITAGLTAFLLSASCMAAMPVNAEETTGIDTTEIIYGDLNSDGNADVTDLSILSLYLIGDTELKGDNALEAADIQYDGTVNLSDLAAFRQYLSKRTNTIGKPSGKDLTAKSVIVNSTAVKYNASNPYPSNTSGLITSMEQYNENFTDKGIDPYLASERLGISEDFFKENSLVYYTILDPYLGIERHITSLKTDPQNNLILGVERYEETTKNGMPVAHADAEQCCFLAAAVPKSELDPSAVASVSVDIKNTDSEYYLDSNIVKKSVISVSHTDYKHKSDDEAYVSIFWSAENLDFNNEFREGKYNGIKDEFVTDDFFKDNALIVVEQPAVKSNMNYKLKEIRVTNAALLEVYIERSEDTKKESENDETEWLLAAAVPKSALVFDRSMSIMKKYVDQPVVKPINTTTQNPETDNTGTEVKGYIITEFGAGTPEELDVWTGKVAGTSTRFVSSMEEYNEKIGSEDFAAQLKRTTGFEIGEGFFENHRLAVMTDSCMTGNGVIFELTSVKTDENGDVHLYYNKSVPEFQTDLGCISHHVVVLPDNPHTKNEAYSHFDQVKNITNRCRIFNSTGVIYNGKEMYPEISGMITSMEQFDKEITAKGIDPAETVSLFGISDEFFEDNFLLFQTKYEGNLRPKNRIFSVSVDSDNNIEMNVSRIEKPKGIVSGGETETLWFHAAAVPKTVIEPENVKSFKSKITENESSVAYMLRGVDFTSAGVHTDNEARMPYYRIFDSSAQLGTGMADAVKYGNIKDEAQAEEMFKDHELLFIRVPAEVSNVTYAIRDIRLMNNGILKVLYCKIEDTDKPAETDNKEWLLTAWIPKEKLMYSADHITVMLYCNDYDTPVH